jgi:hypothetical protein
MRRRTKLSPEKLAEAQERGREFTAYLKASEMRTARLDSAIRVDDVAAMNAVRDEARALGQEQEAVRSGAGYCALQRAILQNAPRCARELCTPSQARIKNDLGENAWLTACRRGMSDIAALLVPFGGTDARCRLSWIDHGTSFTVSAGAVLCALLARDAATLDVALAHADYWAEAKVLRETPACGANGLQEHRSSAASLVRLAWLRCHSDLGLQGSQGAMTREKFVAALDVLGAWLMLSSPEGAEERELRETGLEEVRSVLRQASPGAFSRGETLRQVAPRLHAAIERRELEQSLGGSSASGAEPTADAGPAGPGRAAPRL